MNLAPRTHFGRLAVRSMAYAALAFFLGTSFDLRQLSIVLALSGLAVGIAGGVFALLAIRRERERSPLVYVALLPAGAALLFLVGEMVVPH